MSESVSFRGCEGNRIAADMRGPLDGPAVLLAHGGGQTRHSWGGAAAKLADLGWLAICIDQRGHGDSAWVESGNYSFDDFAGDMAEVARQTEARFNKPVLVGASLGGLAGLLAEGAATQPLFSALVLVDITPRVDPEGVRRIHDFMQGRMREGFKSLEEAAEAVAEYLPHRTRPQTPDGLRKNLRLHADGRYRWHWDPRFYDGPNPINSHREEVYDRMEQAAASLTIPALLIRGRQSELVSEAHAEEFLKTVPHARYTDISGAGHMVAGDKNDIFASAVQDFLVQLRKEPEALRQPRG